MDKREITTTLLVLAVAGLFLGAYVSGNIRIGQWKASGYYQ